jgi:hypothetical protein
MKLLQLKKSKNRKIDLTSKSSENEKLSGLLCCRICLESIDFQNFSFHTEKCYEMTEVLKKLKVLRNELHDLSLFLEETKINQTTKAKKGL